MKALFAFLSDSEIERIHEATLLVLEKTGIKVESEMVRQMLAHHGAGIAGNIVRLPRNDREAIGKIRKEFTWQHVIQPVTWWYPPQKP